MIKIIVNIMSTGGLQDIIKDVFGCFFFSDLVS